jgi:hypothetical protein
MPRVKCSKCTRLYYFSASHGSFSSQTEGKNICGDCNIYSPHNKPYSGEPDKFTDKFKVGTLAAIYDLDRNCYEIVTVQEITPTGTIIAGGRCFRNGRSCHETKEDLVPLTDKIRERCLAYELRSQVRCAYESHHLRLNSDQLSRILDVILEVIVDSHTNPRGDFHSDEERDI